MNFLLSARRGFAYVLGLTVVLTAASAKAADQPPLMTVPGAFSVSDTGAATYTIPIFVPPGTAGMVPKLSLEYGSDNGDGIIGYGWQITGLHSISRCPRTLAEDGVHGGVNYDTNDRFCLDGQRIVSIIGTYGAAYTEYRTELEGFTRIISYGTAGAGPAWFKVWTKSGQIMEFGNTTDSRILAVGTSTARAWAVNKVSDVKGNYYTVTYTNDTTNGQFYPIQINYTGNASASVSPYNSVQFSYNTSRPDVTPTYQAGSLIQTTVLVTDVKTYQGSNLVFDYNLSYALGSSTRHSELDTVTLKDATTNQLATTTFGWQGSRDNPTMTTTTPSLSGASPIIGDFNGDGLTDLISTSTGTCATGRPPYLGSLSGAYSQYGSTCFAQTSTNPNCMNSLPLDLNGNGFLDVYMNCTIYLNNGTGGFTLVDSGTIYSATWGDFNGDGYADSFAPTGYMPPATIFSYSFGNGLGSFAASGVSLSSLTSYNVLFGDFDGDGCTDVLTSGSNSTANYSCAPAVSQSNLPVLCNTSNQTILGDFNGDGKTDILCLTNNTLYLSTGTGFVAHSVSLPAGTYVAGDWNGDGKTDIAYLSAGSGSDVIYLSTGTGFVPFQTVSTSGHLLGGYVADWNNDGAADIWMNIPGQQYLFSYIPELITTISNGIGASTTVSYDRLNKNGGFYTKCPNNPSSYVCGDSYPTQGVDGARYVVSQVSTANGIGGAYNLNYSYAGAKADLKGRGFLGFQQVTVTDPQTGIVHTTNYHTDFPNAGLVASDTRTYSGTTLSSVTNTYTDVNLGTSVEGVTRYFVELSQSVDVANDLSAPLPSTATTYTYDCDTGGACAGTSPTGFGNVVQAYVCTYPQSSTLCASYYSTKTTVNQFNNDATDWFLGELTQAQVTSTVVNPGGPSTLTRTSTFAYDGSTGLLTTEIVEPTATSCNGNSTACELETTYTYDAFGHRIATTVSSPGMASRQSTATYDSLGQFQTGACNALNQCEAFAYDPRFGGMTSHTDANSVTTTWTFDTFGRQSTQVNPDTTYVQWTYAYCHSGGICVSSFAQTQAASATYNSGGTVITPYLDDEYDSLSRPVETGISAPSAGMPGFSSGFWFATFTNYDANGHVLETSRPYQQVPSTSTPIEWTTNLYDVLGRITQSTLPNGGIVTDTYNGLTVSVTDPNGHTTTTTKNAQGLVASVVDANSKTTSYIYDAEGDPLTVTDPNGNTIANTFDIRGQKLTSSDPDMGTWSYIYDGFGELVSQTDAKSQTTTLSYDALSRVTQRVEGSYTSNWVYDQAAHGIGKLYVASTSQGYSRTFNYDSLSRPIKTTLLINNSTFIYQTAYDTDGRVSSISYPSSFTANYVYTSLSQLSQIVDSSTSNPLWTVNARDAELHLLQATAGNGVVTNDSFNPQTGLVQTIQAGASNAVANFSYSFDLIGNLTSRSDANEQVSESYCYDPLNRLINSATGISGASVANCTSSGTNIIDKTVGYDALGNISNKSDVGSYSYGSGAGPHAVTSIAGTYLGLTNPDLAYDANGNMTCMSSGSACSGTIARQAAYTSFNMAASVTQGSTTIGFTYDSEHARITQVQGSTTTVYVNDPVFGSMEEAVSTGGSVTWRDYIKGDGNLVALRTFAPSGSGTNWHTANWGAFNWLPYAATLSYFTVDHLGSVAVVTDQSGNVLERDSYDAWGRRRNSNGTDNAACSITSTTTRGFTGQEMMDSECLINMNARIYDPTAGRFMTADSVIPDTLNGQSYNRYTYVDNGPLSATDPTGNDGASVGDAAGDQTAVEGHVETITITAISYGDALGNISNASVVTGATDFVPTISFTYLGMPGSQAGAPSSSLPKHSNRCNCDAFCQYRMESTHGAFLFVDGPTILDNGDMYDPATGKKIDTDSQANSSGVMTASADNASGGPQYSGVADITKNLPNGLNPDAPSSNTNGANDSHSVSVTDLDTGETVTNSDTNGDTQVAANNPSVQHARQVLENNEIDTSQMSDEEALRVYNAIQEEQKFDILRPGVNAEAVEEGAERNRPPLQFLHSDEAMQGNLSSTNFWSKKSTEEIIESLAPGQREALRVKANGTVVNGQTRLQILQQRGVDINSLPREPYP